MDDAYEVHLTVKGRRVAEDTYEWYNTFRQYIATEFDEEQWYSLVDFVTVFNKEDIRFIFKDGTEIKV